VLPGARVHATLDPHRRYKNEVGKESHEATMLLAVHAPGQTGSISRLARLVVHYETFLVSHDHNARSSGFIKQSSSHKVVKSSIPFRSQPFGEGIRNVVSPAKVVAKGRVATKGSKSRPIENRCCLLVTRLRCEALSIFLSCLQCTRSLCRPRAPVANDNVCGSFN
jgi:hypothetical protein